jgi:predicted unusual protein kinase regulating ubiquinone biosynthesis (AarF/ABC1/UbiB family)
VKTNAGSPTRRAMRVAGLGVNVAGSYLGYLVQRAFLDDSARVAKLRSVNKRAAERMRGELQAMRGPAMKLGQALSVQGGVLPDEMLAELSKLQMEAPGMHPSLMRAQFRSSMGHDPEEVFRSFEETPFAAASLGQVHRAVTNRKESVAIKIQYPAIREAVANDFAWFRAVSKPAQKTGHVPKNVIDELEREIMAETDYIREAGNAEFFGKALSHLPFVSVPRIYREYSGEGVLTMSFIEGHSLDVFLRQNPSRATRDLIGERLFELFHCQMLRVGAFHADPHSGNYLLGRDGRIGLVDFGCVKYLAPQFVAALREAYLYPGDRNSEHFKTLLEKQYAWFGARLTPKSRQALVEFAQRFYSKVYPPDRDDQPFDFGRSPILQEYLDASGNLVRARGVLPEYTFIARAELGLYHALHRLRARVHTSRIVRKYL